MAVAEEESAPLAEERSERLSDRVARAGEPVRAVIQEDGSIVIELDVYTLETTSTLPSITYRDSFLTRLLNRRDRTRRQRYVARRSPRA